MALRPFLINIKLSSPKKVQLLPIKAQILSRRKVELLGFDSFLRRETE